MREFHTSKNEVEYTYKNRMALRKHFQDYFVLNFAENTIKKETINEILEAKSQKEYNDIFDKYDFKELKRFEQLAFKMSVYVKDFKSSEFIYYLWGIFDKIYGEKDFYCFNKYRIYLEIFSILKEKENIVSDKLLDDNYSLDVRMLFIYSCNFSDEAREYIYEKELKILLEKLFQKNNEEAREKILTHINIVWRVNEKGSNKLREITKMFFVKTS